MTDPILTLPEVVILLKVAEQTVHAMAQSGQIPAFKVRGQSWFKHDDIDVWGDEQKAVVKGNAAEGTSNV